VYFEGDIKTPIFMPSCLDDTGIEISCSAAVFYGIIDEFISDENESPLPWSHHTMTIEYLTYKISDYF
jgi:hypothetical protein